MSNDITTVPTKPFDGQKPGTSGLRKRVKVFQQEHYTENFIQAIFDVIEPQGSTLVIGGDGRYFSPETVQTILKIGAANGVSKFIVGKDSILSTPAASNVIRKYKAKGGILLTASHNPGGPDKDFGIKYNVSNGGPAPEGVTDSIYEKTKTIESYKLVKADPLDLSKIGEFSFTKSTSVQIIDSVADYVEMLESIFDFPLIKSFLSSRANEFRVLFDGLHGVTGPYAEAMFVKVLGLPKSSVQNCVPLPDFGGGHPDPNMEYARTLVDAVEKDGIEFGAASDGDGDRNMIYGKNAFVTPSDSVAIIAHWADVIPYFKNGGVKGLARSMPTSKAIDLVAKKKGFEYFEVPTGWKFFGNLMDAGRLSICGEESFGTGSDHIREKDGLWAVIAWLNILAAANAKSPNKLIGINDLLYSFYEIYGRSFFSRYDYEEVPSEGAQKLVDHLNDAREKGTLDNSVHASSAGSFTVSNLYDFEYKDPVDGSVSKKQGQVITFSDGSRVVFRLSGTGSQGATVRMYVERYVAPEAGEAELRRNTAEGLKGLIEVALKLSKLDEFLGGGKPIKPTVITVSRPFSLPTRTDSVSFTVNG
ncbi:phosphoglucomutase [Roridomyces roridus]|uniref:phosphoglucomutase (alpha-D-glucose-1,6-bisphosphate-dependent) n=1 Tax=Roridomyces roridus TaxID=1738132 RepID=A0AAD7BJE7_9AGAR|nr:phosphoglucomutase [Roridomyces roridus]